MAFLRVPSYILLFSLYHLTALAGSTCFFPSGAIHKLGSACDPSASVSNCCEGTHTCLSNNLCFDTQNNHVIRGSCTDSSFPYGCSHLCPRDATGALSSVIADLRQCNGQNSNWVCSLDVTNCSNSFPIPFGFVEDYRPSGTNNILADGPKAATASGSATAGVVTVTVTATGGSASSTQSAAAAAMSTDSKSTTHGVNSAALGAGLGVGLPLLFALIASLWLLFRAKRKIRELRNAPGPASVPNHVIEHHQEDKLDSGPLSPAPNSVLKPLPEKPIYEAGFTPSSDRHELGTA